MSKLEKVPFNADRVYLIQLIAAESGRKSPAQVCTPRELVAWMNESEQAEEMDPKKYYVDVLMDCVQVADAEGDEALNTSDCIMSFPVMSLHSFKLLVTRDPNPEEESKDER